MIFGMSFALAAIYYTSKSSWLCILFHTMINALSGSWIIEDNILIKTSTAIIMITFSFIMVMWQKKKFVC